MGTRLRIGGGEEAVEISISSLSLLPKPFSSRLYVNLELKGLEGNHIKSGYFGAFVSVAIYTA